MLRSLMFKMTEEQKVLQCGGCQFFQPKSRIWCTRKGKRETGKLGKCLNKKKSHF